jgi:hypothetical protein
MRCLIACVVCLCLGIGGCCVLEKAGDAMGKAIGEAIVRALTQHFIADLMDTPLTASEVAVFDVYGLRPEVLPWYMGAEIARFVTQKLGIAPASPFGLVCRFLQSACDSGSWVWRFLWWLNCPVAPA